MNIDKLSVKELKKIQSKVKKNLDDFVEKHLADIWEKIIRIVSTPIEIMVLKEVQLMWNYYANRLEIDFFDEPRGGPKHWKQSEELKVKLDGWKQRIDVNSHISILADLLYGQCWAL